MELARIGGKLLLARDPLRSENHPVMYDVFNIIGMEGDTLVVVAYVTIDRRKNVVTVETTIDRGERIQFCACGSIAQMLETAADHLAHILKEDVLPVW